MSNAIEAAKSLRDQAAEVRANEKKALLIKARQMAKAIVTETDLPAPEEILALCDSLRVDLEWFTGTDSDDSDGVVPRCKKRFAQAQGFAQIPGYRAEIEKLEALEAELTVRGSEVKAIFDSAWAKIKNLGDGRFSAYERGTTREQLADMRAKRDAFAAAYDEIWLVKRDTELLREKIGELKKIDQSIIDPESPEPAPWDFMLPPV